jgi:uncharacterized DUF497 family protein
MSCPTISPEGGARPDWQEHYIVCIGRAVGDLRFVWDERKSATNARKHGVAFAEAETVFLDDEALLIADPDHSDDEDRFVLLGLSARLRTLVVCHCYREEDSTIRIISARKANRHERAIYAQRRRR